MVKPPGHERRRLAPAEPTAGAGAASGGAAAAGSGSGAEAESIGITAEVFHDLARQYRTAWAVRVAAVAADGSRRLSSGWWRGPDPAGRRELMAFVVQEALRWGEPTITYGEGGDFYWAVPLMHNAALLGGIVATMHEDVLFPGESSTPSADLRRACSELRRLAERLNLTNAALLEARRWTYACEQDRAELLQTSKLERPLGVRQLYLQAEPQLMAALRRGDRPQARMVLNQILTSLLSAAGNHFGLVRSFLIELVATMCRTAVEAGGDVDELLGTGYDNLSELAAVTSMEALAPCLHDVLERTISAMEQHRESTQQVVIASAVAYMREHLASDLSRDAVAEAMFLSPSHFSRLFKQHMGCTFGETLARIRGERAAELLVRTNLSIGRIARASGFRDASYFGKVFRQQFGLRPSDFRASQHHNAVAATLHHRPDRPLRRPATERPPARPAPERLCT